MSPFHGKPKCTVVAKADPRLYTKSLNDKFVKTQKEVSINSLRLHVWRWRGGTLKTWSNTHWKLKEREISEKWLCFSYSWKKKQQEAINRLQMSCAQTQMFVLVIARSDIVPQSPVEFKGSAPRSLLWIHSYLLY